jgi:uncharacterized protein YjiS (DUF1127 family)
MTQAIIAASNALHINAVLDFFRDLNRKLENRSKINATIKELNQLTDRELNDIGLARGDIWAVAHGDTDYARNAKPESNENLKGWV